MSSSSLATTLSLHQVDADRGQRRILSGVTVTVRGGEVVVLAGANGAGKSTLVQAILGRCPARGSIRVGADEVATLTPRQRARCISAVPQRSQLRAPIPVQAVVAGGRYAHGGAFGQLSARDRAAIDHALDLVDAGHLRDRPFTELSGGEQQRVLVARALASEAGVLIGDEPTTGLDPRHALELLRTLRAVAAGGRAVLVVLHHLHEIRALADRVVLLHQGRILVDAEPSQALTSEYLRQAYGVEPDAEAGFGIRLWEPN